MRIPLTYVKLRDTLDSVEPLNTTGLNATRGWQLTLDTDLGTILGILTRGEGAGAVVTRVEFSMLAATHWVRENWGEMPALLNEDAARHLLDILSRDQPPNPQPKQTGGKRGPRKAAPPAPESAE